MYYSVCVFHSSSSKDSSSPTHHIDTMHTEYLQKICSLSNLEGLRYVGGPLLDPCTVCGETQVVRYVSYFEGEDLPSKSECPNCHEGYDVHQLLTNRVCTYTPLHVCICI